MGTTAKYHGGGWRTMRRCGLPLRAVKELGGGWSPCLASSFWEVSPFHWRPDVRPAGRERARAVGCAARGGAGLGSPLHDPFMQLGFLALEVIPKLKLTDLGLADVDVFDFVPLWVE